MAADTHKHDKVGTVLTTTTKSSRLFVFLERLLESLQSEK